MKTLARTLLILSALILSACSLGGKTVPLTIIEPQLGPVDTAGLTPVEWAIEVPRPITDQTRDSDRLIVRRDGGRLQVYPGVSWVDSLPEMVQTLIVQSLSDSGQFAAVGRSGLHAPYALATELRRFELVDDGDGQRVELVITANLIDQRDRLSLGIETFRASEPLASGSLDATITAFEVALVALVDELMPWVLETGEISVDETGWLEGSD